MDLLLQPGIDLIPATHLLHKCQLALLTNDAAKTGLGKPTRLALLENGFKITRLFSPEHGIGANEADGKAVHNQSDHLTGLPVVSLYGESLKPSQESLQGIDAVVFDIPDVGSRFYTYLWSMTYMMEACSEIGIPFVVLDRPNPIGGNLSIAEGPMLDESNCSSFIGRWRIPIRHCCTLGELALFFQATRLPNLKLEVIACKGWNRKVSFFESGNPFIPTSPAICDAETALLYPGTCLLEGLEINEGRGTDRPFKQAGAPWIVAHKWQSSLSESAIMGVETACVTFVPEWGLYQGETCKGLQFHITDANAFRPVSFGLELIRQLMFCFGEKVKPRLYKTRANPDGEQHLDLLLGTPGSFEYLKKGGMSETNISAEWTDIIKPFLLY
jgi:uncharacterized protein YbbC (DUF1343 family)